ncbi:MAG: prepilin-type N-terminal cleavage/methylation domain-containing protein [Bacilli bacterium]|nr:prepilin-type N-terminal cleavage/methylation domain-containing protein [Bacilli bacterium]
MKKGFTLIELLAVLVLLSIIGLIAVPAISNILKTNGEKISESQKTLVEKAAKNWANANAFSLPGNSEEASITIESLKEEGYLENSDIKNIDDNSCVIIQNTSGKYTFTFEENC